MELFDTHAHLDDKRLLVDLSGVLARAAAAGVANITTIGCDWPTSLYATHLAGRHQNVWAAVGIHPHDADVLDEEMYERLWQLAKEETKVVAIGEIGLDYYRNECPRDVQQKAFARQLQMARALGKPVVIHDRDAHEDTLRILRQEKGGANGGILHCFSGSWEMAKECLNLGFHISFAGPLTYPNAKKLPEVASRVPEDLFLVETDCPYLAPQAMRGKTNEPAYVRFTAEFLAGLRGESLETVAEQSTRNAKAVYRIPA